MFNWDILPNPFLFNSPSSMVSTGITQSVRISSLQIYLEEILKLNKSLLKSKFLKIGTKQPKNTVSLSSSFEMKQICWTCYNNREWTTNFNMNQFCCTLTLIQEDFLRVCFEVGKGLGIQLTLSSSLIQNLLDLCYQNIPFSTKTFLILLISAFLCKNQHFFWQKQYFYSKWQ